MKHDNEFKAVISDNKLENWKKNPAKQNYTEPLLHFLHIFGVFGFLGFLGFFNFCWWVFGYFFGVVSFLVFF